MRENRTYGLTRGRRVKTLLLLYFLIGILLDMKNAGSDSTRKKESMKRNVLKFGGTSVSSLEKIKEIANSLKERSEQGEQLIVVVSAMGKTTDELMEQVDSITTSPNEEDLAVLLTTGEQQTISYLSIILNDLGVKSKPLTGYQAGIETVGKPLKSKISKINTELFEDLFSTYNV